MTDFLNQREPIPWRETAQNIPSTEQAFRIDRNEVFKAIAIGATSHFDRCYVYPAGQSPGRWTAPHTNVTAHALLREAIEVSVERPFVGNFPGPIGVILPYASTYDDSGKRGSVPVASGSSSMFGTAEDAREVVYPVLELDLYRACPLWLPTHRAPLESAGRLDQFGVAAGVSSKTIRFPTYGRVRHSLTLVMSGRTAGSVDWRVYGRNLMRVGTLTSDLTIGAEHDLQALTTEAADFQRVYYFDGEFDQVILTLAEQGALNADVFVEWIWKSWDR